jgi:hypothetical protein
LQKKSQKLKRNCKNAKEIAEIHKKSLKSKKKSQSAKEIAKAKRNHKTLKKSQKEIVKCKLIFHHHNVGGHETRTRPAVVK